MGRKERCELLLEHRPVPGPEFLTRRWPLNMEWTLLRAPLDLPDGEYLVSSDQGHQFRATRINGFWTHQDPAAPPLTLAGALPETTVPGPDLFRKVRHFAQLILQFDQRYAISVLLFAALITYGLPTVVELMAARDLHLGFLTLLFGDFIGCACLVTFLEMPVFGVILYVLLTVVEACLYYTGMLSPGHLAWFADLVPMIVVIRKIARLRSAAPPANSERFSS